MSACPPAGATLSEEYVTEYSTDRIEMHVGAVQAGQRVVLVDDLIATGGTLRECRAEGRQGLGPHCHSNVPLGRGLPHLPFHQGLLAKQLTTLAAYLLSLAMCLCLQVRGSTL